MSGKAARKLRRLAEVMTNGKQGDTTVHDDIAGRAYKAHKVASSKKPRDWQDRGPVAEVIRLDPKSTRAFYQEAKKQMKDGTAKAEADTIQKDYRADMRAESKKASESLDRQVAERHATVLSVDENMQPINPPQLEQLVFPEQDKNMNPMEWLDNFTGWAIDNHKRIEQTLPFQIISGLSSVEAGYLTVTGLEKKTENGLTFVISSAGHIRLNNDKVIQLLGREDIVALYREVHDALVGTMRHYKEIKMMEVRDAV